MKMVTLIRGLQYKGMLSPEHTFNIEIPYKNIDYLLPSKAYKILVNWLAIKTLSKLLWYIWYSSTALCLYEKGWKWNCVLKWGSFGAEWPWAGGLHGSNIITAKHICSCCGMVCSVEQHRCWHTIGTKELLYQTNELFGVLFQLDISERIPKPGKSLLFLF